DTWSRFTPFSDDEKEIENVFSVRASCAYSGS
ncbi:unnamed protein product, partial [marine sediment metagenome]